MEFFMLTRNDVCRAPLGLEFLETTNIEVIDYECHFCVVSFVFTYQNELSECCV